MRAKGANVIILTVEQIKSLYNLPGIVQLFTQGSFSIAGDPGQCLSLVLIPCVQASGELHSDQSLHCSHIGVVAVKQNKNNHT